MSIAELIMQGTNRASESTSWVGDSLAKLGQNVGAALAQREQQKQAQEMLPFLQQSMQESMTLAGEGKSGEAYAKLMPFITNPSVINNPNLMPAVDAALKLNQLATNDFLKKEQLRVREDMYNARYGGGGGEPQESGAEMAQQMVFGGQPNKFSNIPLDEQARIKKDAQDAAANAVLLPDETGTATQTGMPAMQPDKTQLDAANAAAQATDATPERYSKAVEGATINKSDKDNNWQPTEIAGLSSFFPKENISDEIRIAPIGSTTEYSQTWSGETDKPGARFSGTKKVEVDDALNKKANEYASKLQESVNFLSGNGPSEEDKTWSDIVQEAGGIANIIPATSGGEEYSVKIKGGQSYPIDKDTFDAFGRVKGFPAFASRTGIKAVTKGGSATAELAGRKFGSVAEAEKANLDAGTIIYIYDSQTKKYRKATVKSDNQQ